MAEYSGYKHREVKECWDKLSHSDEGKDEKHKCKSLLKQCLTKDVYEQLKDKKTGLGGTLADCIQSGSVNLESNVGIYACDPEAYDTFDTVLDDVIRKYHGIKGEIKHPKPDFGDPKNFDLGDLDPSGEFIDSTRVRVGRSHKGKPFPPCCSKEEFEEMEKMSVEAFNSLEGALKGTYHPLFGMTKEDQQQLIDDHFLFRNNDPFLGDAGGYQFWPHGRGIFFNTDKTFLAWVNEEDHLRLISMQKGGNLEEVWNRLVSALKQLEKKLAFAHDDKHGYLTFCPTNLGTTCRASVHIKVPKLEASGELKTICDKYTLQPRGLGGEHTKSVGGKYDISNKRRMGLTEIAAVREMRDGIKAIIKREKELQ